jgi:hypothetical protein
MASDVEPGGFPNPDESYDAGFADGRAASLINLDREAWLSIGISNGWLPDESQAEVEAIFDGAEHGLTAPPA